MSKNKILIHKNKHSPTKSPKEAFGSLWKPKVNTQKQSSLGPELSAHRSPFSSAEQVSTGRRQGSFPQCDWLQTALRLARPSTAGTVVLALILLHTG